MGIPMLESILLDLGISSEAIQERPEGAAFLKAAKAAYPLAAITYVALNIPTGPQRNQYMQCAYSDRWLKQSVSQKPICMQRLGALGRVFHQANDAGEPTFSSCSDREKRCSLSFPLRATHGEVAALCITMEGWPAPRDVLTKEFQALGSYFHQHMLRIWGHDTAREMLISVRELECLKWIAEGKTAWEAGVILGISERTVRFHLNAAREKLDCLTTTQAVAKAVATQLIEL